MANKKFKNGNTLDSSQIYDAGWGDTVNNIIKYTLECRQSWPADLNNCLSTGVYPYKQDTINTPIISSYGVILNIISWGGEKTSSNWLWQIAFDTNNLVFIRNKINDGGWTSWKQII